MLWVAPPPTACLHPARPLPRGPQEPLLLFTLVGVLAGIVLGVALRPAQLSAQASFLRCRRGQGEAGHSLKCALRCEREGIADGALRLLSSMPAAPHP